MFSRERGGGHFIPGMCFSQGEDEKKLTWPSPTAVLVRSLFRMSRSQLAVDSTGLGVFFVSGGTAVKELWHSLCPVDCLVGSLGSIYGRYGDTSDLGLVHCARSSICCSDFRCDSRWGMGQDDEHSSPSPPPLPSPPFMPLAEHLTALRLVQEMSAWALKVRRPPSQRCTDTRVYGLADLQLCVMMITPPPPIPPVPPPSRFDHHQKTFHDTLSEESFTTRLSSAGLVYKHFGRRILKVLVEGSGVPDKVVDEKLYAKVYKVRK